MKDPAQWPAPLRAELGDDWGTAAAGKARAVYRRHFAEARQVLDEFRPDVTVPIGRQQDVVTLRWQRHGYSRRSPPTNHPPSLPLYAGMRPQA